MRERAGENVVNGVKTIMVNDPLRTPGPASHRAAAAVLRRRPAAKRPVTTDQPR